MADRKMIYLDDAIDALAYFTEKSPTGRTAQEVVKDLPSAQPSSSCVHEKDTISRQAVIDAIDKYSVWVMYTQGDSQKDEAEFVESIIKQTKKAIQSMLIEDLSSAQPEHQWIPCSERLPEEDGQYLVTVRYKHVDGYDDVYAEHGDWCDGNWDMFCFGHCGEVESILAWRPLPEPYMGGQKE